jgi:hypothetical protein
MLLVTTRNLKKIRYGGEREDRIERTGERCRVEVGSESRSGRRKGIEGGWKEGRGPGGWDSEGEGKFSRMGVAGGRKEGRQPGGWEWEGEGKWPQWVQGRRERGGRR